jgi:structural maintenance of chromosome 4
MSGRPSRRAAAARRAIVDSDDDEEEVANTTRVKHEDESEEDFAPEAEAEAEEEVIKAPRRRTGGRRKTSTVASTSAPRASRSRKSTAPSIESSQIFSPDESMATVAESETPVKEAATPTKQPAKKRKSTAPRKASKESSRENKETTPEPVRPASQDSVPTPRASGTPRASVAPRASATPEPPQTVVKPLADITNHSLNEVRQVDKVENSSPVKPIKAMDTILEKPMDIVLKSRAQMTMPIEEETGPKARIVIENLILTNFKSYAGRQEVGPFHASFTSVVGPNGSGKSNVIDSLLFVFGFRASKMRQGKISALIHHSNIHPDLNHCEVAVHFKQVMDLVRIAQSVSWQES